MGEHSIIAGVDSGDPTRKRGTSSFATTSCHRRCQPKQFTAGEKVNLQLRAEFFNFGEPPAVRPAGPDYRQPSAGVITATVGTARHSVQLTPPVLIDVPRLAGVPKYSGLANA
jgi:hypothetical protein